MSSDEEDDKPSRRVPNRCSELSREKPIPVFEFNMENETKPKKSFLRKGTGLLRYRMKPNQNIRKKTFGTNNVQKDKSEIKILPDTTVQALKRPHDNWDSFMENLSHVSNLNDSTAEKEELSTFESLEREIVNHMGLSSALDLEPSPKHWLGKFGCSQNDRFAGFPVPQIYTNSTEFIANEADGEIFSNNLGDIANADNEITEILEDLYISNPSVSHDECETSEDYNDEGRWKVLMDMTGSIYQSSLDLPSLLQPSILPAEKCPPSNDNISVTSKCSSSKQETGVQVSEDTNPFFKQETGVQVSEDTNPLCNDLQERLKNVESEINMYKTKCTELNSQIKHGDAEKERLKKDLDRLVLTESNLKKKVQEIGQRKVKLNNLHENDKKLVNKKAEECLLLKKQMQEIKDNFIEKENQYKALENKNKKLVAEVASLKKKIDFMKQKISVKSVNKADKTTSTRDMFKLNKDLREQYLIDALTIRDVVPMKPIPNHLMHTIGTQVNLANNEVSPMVFKVSESTEQVNTTLLTEQDNPINTEKTFMKTAVNCSKGSSSDAISSTVNSLIDCTQDNLGEKKRDRDSHSLLCKESRSTLAQECQERSSTEASNTYKNEKTIKLKSKEKQFLNSLVSIRREIGDGRRETIFLNGTKKFSSADGNQVKVLYVNGDILKKDYTTGTESYYFASHNSWQTKHSDGRKTLEFLNGQTETYYPNGTKLIEMPDGKEFTVFKSGVMKWLMPDGTTHIHTKDGKRLSLFKNGQKELQLKRITVRQYPDGTTSIRYPNGFVETRYWNGRRRLKNRFGVLISDTGLNKK